MAGQNVDLFDEYFRRADLDRDGKISGQEAVTFFQASGLQKPVLAQIWMYANRNRSGFLGRADFYNALKLVTVAQSKRELTQDIVQAALFGPAAARIPAPQINLAALAAPQMGGSAPAPQMGGATPGPQMSGARPGFQMNGANPTLLMNGANPALQMGGANPTPQMGGAAAATSQNLGYRGPQAVPNVGASQQQFPTQPNQFMRPPMPAGAGSLPAQSVPGQGFPVRGTMAAPRPPTSSVSTDWLSGMSGGQMAPSGATSQIPSRGVTPPTSQGGFGMGPSTGLNSSAPPRPQANSGMTQLVSPRPSNQVQSSFQPAPKDSKALVPSGNGFASDSIFGGDVFSAISSQPKQDSSSSAFSASSLPVPSAIVPVSSAPQSLPKHGSLDSLQSTFSMQPSSGQLQRTQSLTKPNQQISPTQSTSTFMSTGISAGASNSASNQSQAQWPRMTQSDIQKYTKVFVEVDTDRDGKITGDQAKNLFLSWRLERAVLKQVWDLSDQDNDSMLSLREFCIALYLMERFREGRPLPAVLPNNIMFDENPMPTVGQPTAAYGNTAWGPGPGLQQQQQGMPGARQMMPAVGSRSQQMQLPPTHPQTDRGLQQPNQQKSRVPVLEKHSVNQLSNEEQNSLNSKFEEATEADKKVEELEKEILDSREKIEFYRTKMQELVLYKSRCDNRLNEITERALADKKEVESLGKKYEEKYKQVGDIASKLTIEEATFRDIQERKMELYNALVKIEQGGSTDGILQVRADRIQADLEELVKALNDRCKKYGLHVKPTALVELPFGWQPGIQEGAADWDEDWDKFEDEGFTFVKDLTLDVQNVIAPPKEKTKPVWKEEKASVDEGLTADSSSNADSKSEKPNNTGEHFHDAGSPYDARSEDGSARSPGSPTCRSTLESPSQEFREGHFAKSFDSSPRAKETHSDHGGAESIISGDKSFDEPTWGTFDNNDDTDSLWGFNASKDSDYDRNKDSFFGSNDFGLEPIRTGSPQASSLFAEKKSPFNFADSVPGTPFFNSGNSPRYSEAGDRQYDAFSSFGSFNDRASYPPGDSSLARFDSMRSTRDSDNSRGFPSFDDSDPFGSSGPFTTSSDPKKNF